MSLADVTIPKVIGNWYLGEKLGAGFSGKWSCLPYTQHTLDRLISSGRCYL